MATARGLAAMHRSATNTARDDGASAIRHCPGQRGLVACTEPDNTAAAVCVGRDLRSEA